MDTENKISGSRSSGHTVAFARCHLSLFHFFCAIYGTTFHSLQAHKTLKRTICLFQAW